VDGVSNDVSRTPGIEIRMFSYAGRKLPKHFSLTGQRPRNEAVTTSVPNTPSKVPWSCARGLRIFFFFFFFFCFSSTSGLVVNNSASALTNRQGDVFFFFFKFSGGPAFLAKGICYVCSTLRCTAESHRYLRHGLLDPWTNAPP